MAQGMWETEFEIVALGPEKSQRNIVTDGALNPKPREQSVVGWGLQASLMVPWEEERRAAILLPPQSLNNRFCQLAGLTG